MPCIILACCPLSHHATLYARGTTEILPLLSRLDLGTLQTSKGKTPLPFLYLADSIVKNIGQPYMQLFEQRIVKMFRHCYKHVSVAAHPCPAHT